MAMPAIQQINDNPMILRRFNAADLSKHGGWILKRLIKAYPHQNERGVASWLREIINDNSSLFLYQEHGVALAQVLNIDSLSHKPVVYERFVFVEEGHELQGSDFYLEIVKWAKNMGIEKVIVQELSDVPLDLVKEKLGRLYTRQQIFARI